MLLNISGAIIRDKLRDVVIFEADLKFANHLYFGSSLMKIS